MIEGSVAGTMLRLFLSLATVLTLMVFLARYLRNRQLGTGVGIGATQRRKKALLLEVVTRQGLSRGSSLAVVRVSGQLLLLGVTESTVSVLRELEEVSEPEFVPEVQDAASPAHSPATSPFGLGAPVASVVSSAVEMLRQRTVRRG